MSVSMRSLSVPCELVGPPAGVLDLSTYLISMRTGPRCSSAPTKRSTSREMSVFDTPTPASAMTCTLSLAVFTSSRSLTCAVCFCAPALLSPDKVASKLWLTLKLMWPLAEMVALLTASRSASLAAAGSRPTRSIRSVAARVTSFASRVAPVSSCTLPLQTWYCAFTACACSSQNSTLLLRVTASFLMLSRVQGTATTSRVTCVEWVASISRSAVPVPPDAAPGPAGARCRRACTPEPAEPARGGVPRPASTASAWVSASRSSGVSGGSITSDASAGPVAAPRCCTVWVSSCASRCRPGFESGR